VSRQDRLPGVESDDLRHALHHGIHIAIGERQRARTVSESLTGKPIRISVVVYETIDSSKEADEVWRMRITQLRYLQGRCARGSRDTGD
jgi:hypothetical protein